MTASSALADHLSPLQLAAARGVGVGLVGAAWGVPFAASRGWRVAALTAAIALTAGLAVGVTVFVQQLVRRRGTLARTGWPWCAGALAALLVLANAAYAQGALAGGAELGLERLGLWLRDPRFLVAGLALAAVFSTALHLATTDSSARASLVPLLLANAAVVTALLLGASAGGLDPMLAALAGLFFGPLVFLGAVPLAVALAVVFGVADTVAGRCWPPRDEDGDAG